MTPTKTISRRDLLTAHASRRAAPSPRLLFRPESGPRGDVLVCLFWRGGMDGLYVVPPHGDGAYYSQRPSLAIPRPDDGRAAKGARAVDLDGFFGLHPNLAPLKEAYSAGQLAVIHACGTPDRTHPHFEAMETMERGVDDGSAASSGWLGRPLSSLDTGHRSPVRAIAFGATLPHSLQGARGATAVPSLAQFRL